MKRFVEEGWTVKDACEIVEISRSRYYALNQPKCINRTDSHTKNVELIDKIKRIKELHPFWGYRLTHA